MDFIQIKKYYIIVKNFLLGSKNKEFLIFLFFFFISAAFWLLQSLNEVFDVEIKVPLKLENIPSDVVITSDLPSEMRVVTRDKGILLIQYLYGAEQEPVSIDYEAYDKGNTSGHVRVALSDVQKKIQAKLLSSTQIVSLRPDTLEYFFNKGLRKKVPVRMVGAIDTSPEYYLQQVSCIPDSIEVLAPSVILDTITEVRVNSLFLSDLSANRKLRRGLTPIRGTKFIPQEVDVDLKVDLYTEKTVEVPVLGVNFPGSKDLRTFPSNVNITFRVGMSRFKDITADDFVLAVTYEELMRNEHSKIKLHLKSLPEGVSNVRIEPSEVDYLIEQVSGEGE